MPPLLRPSLYALPPSLRASLYQQHQQQQRSFSASAARKSPLSDALLYCPTLLLDVLHTGLPWHTAIPLSAILVRTLLVYHISALPARKAAITRVNLHPLSAARFRSEYISYRERAADEKIQDAANGRTISEPEMAIMAIRMKIMRGFMAVRSSHRTGKEYGAPAFTWWRSPVNFGVLIAMTEAVRVKCGAREGLLSFLAKSIDQHVDPETARRAAMTPDEILVERLEAAYAAKQQSAGTPAQPVMEGEEGMSFMDEESTSPALQDMASDQLPALNTNIYAGVQDPSLKTEGLAWFPDLTLADSTLLLPFGLSTAIALTVLTRPNPNPAPVIQTKKNENQTPKDDDPLAALAALPPQKSPLDKLSTGQKLGLSVSLVFFFVAAKLPAAVLLYLIPSTVCGWLQTRWLDMKYPLPQMVTPCVRPVRVKVRKEFRDA
ncbi:uncharacterized protein RCC_11170 [Ramularia collo-cygni]|uniref:Uncharacterized protein n=1 Tax=Ramularia collo-cygni TaxID=112498 RepID=A0A2D3VSB0_9PEZI|nr:uncharacterized protein RCC_11170 [Ramularia collo-cygni]CZT25438.1 uncharacterized protein RCC_11170 [Ramularia collo-cygni]